MSIGVFTAVCEEDDIWVGQYLTEMNRLNLPFVIHFDRCSESLKNKFRDHPLCVYMTAQNTRSIEFNETHKQQALDVLRRAEFKWAINLDIDETFEKDAPQQLAAIEDRSEDCLSFRWANVWEEPQQLRVDGPFNNSYRAKIYNLQGNRHWKFCHPITNGCKLVDEHKQVLPEGTLGTLDLTCLHWGLMTKQLRLLHQARWDRIYSSAVGENPYGLWKDILDEETFPPKLTPNIYLPVKYVLPTSVREYVFKPSSHRSQS